MKKFVEIITNFPTMEALGAPNVSSGESDSSLDRTQKEELQFPDSYVPEILETGALTSLVKTCESMDYVSDFSMRNKTLIEQSMEALDSTGKEFSHLQSIALKRQITSVLNNSPIELLKEKETLEKQLTSNGPYQDAEEQKQATLEALTELSDQLSIMAQMGSGSLKQISEYLKTSAIGTNGLAKRLEDCVQSSELTGSIKERVQTQAVISSVVAQILTAVRNGYSPEDVPGQIRLEEGKVSAEGCVLIAKGNLAVPLRATRDMTVADVKSLAKYMDLTLSVQEQFQLLLTSESDVDFFKQIRSSQDSDRSGRVHFDIAHGWAGVRLNEDNSTSTIVCDDFSTYGNFRPSEAIEIMRSLLVNVLPKFQLLAEKTENTGALLPEKIQSLQKDAAVEKRQQLEKILLASKFASKLTLSLVQAVVCISEAVMNVAKGVSLLK